MKFGNWNVTAESVEYAGNPLQRFVVTSRDLLNTEQVDGVGSEVYQSVLRATEEDWLTSDDLYDLNFALMYFAGSAGLAIDYEMFDRTLEYQFNLLDEEDEEQG